MIISDRHRFVFVHVPKCAGTSVRRALAPFDDTGGFFSERVSEDPVHGRIDFTHLPLHALGRIAPDAFGKLGRYRSFAIARDPFDRFSSALSQQMKMYRGVEIAQASDAEVAATLDDVIAFLGRQPRVTDPSYIHFCRQTDFVDLDGRRLVDDVFPLDRLDLLACEIGRLVGRPVEIGGRENPTLVLRYPRLRSVVRQASSSAKRWLPERLSERLRQTGRSLLVKQAGGELPRIYRSSEIRAFVAEFYEADVRLFEESVRRAAEEPVAESA
jgi:hypothetical protein